MTHDVSTTIEAYGYRVTKKDDRLVRMFRALGHPNRFRLFAEIAKEGERAYQGGHYCFLHTIMERLDVGAPTVSHHLKELVHAELITTERQGKFVTCRANPEALGLLSQFFGRPVS